MCATPGVTALLLVYCRCSRAAASLRRTRLYAFFVFSSPFFVVVVRGLFLGKEEEEEQQQQQEKQQQQPSKQISS